MLFRNENPVLGPSTQVNEQGTLASNSTLVSNNFKPGTREIFSIPLAAASALTAYLFQAPWACQVVAIRYNCTTAAAAGVLSVERIIGDAVAPAAANGTTIILLSAATATLSGFAANTRQNLALSVAAGNPLVLNAGDQIAYFLSTAPTSLVGGVLQIEVAQIG
jgi:hypothetical protein